MCIGSADRRRALAGFAAIGACGWLGYALPVRAQAAGAARFAAEAARQREIAIARGDQPYGAVLVKDDVIVGYGASAVVADRNPDAHAERVALWDAQRRLGARELPGTLIYSTSPPCSACQAALAAANVARMFYGPSATDGGPPRRG